MEGKQLIFEKETYVLRGICYEVQNELGRYRNEKQYGDAIELRLQQQRIPYKREFVLPKSFDGEKCGRNRIDFLTFDSIILELKHKPAVSRDDYYQSQRYLVSLDVWLLLLINFGTKYVQIKRVLNHEKYKQEGGFSYSPVK